MTYWMWLTIAHPWQRIPQHSLDGTRNALMKMIRAQHQGLTPEEREDGELPIDIMLEMLLHGSRSASWTQKHGHRCVKCSSKTFGTIPSQRVNQIGYLEDPDAIRGSTRSWPNWINRAFIGQSADNHDDGGLYCKKEACAAENAELVPINMVLDRMPLYLIVSHGFENFGEGRLLKMFDHLTVIHDTPWKNNAEAFSRWAGLIERINGNHFVLHWKLSDGTVWTYDGQKPRASRASPTSLEQLSAPYHLKGPRRQYRKGIPLGHRVCDEARRHPERYSPRSTSRQKTRGQKSWS